VPECAGGGGVFPLNAIKNKEELDITILSQRDQGDPGPVCHWPGEREKISLSWRYITLQTHLLQARMTTAMWRSPRATYLMLGPTGVGKTYLARPLLKS
jgi:putative ribosome biogenesis GTPase RsgA